MVKNGPFTKKNKNYTNKKLKIKKYLLKYT